MRKIEKIIVSAVRNRQNVNTDNTRVELCSREDGKPLARIYLHGNHIATVGYNAETQRITDIAFTLAGWDTKTTRGRIHLLLSEFFNAGMGRHKKQTCIIYNLRGERVYAPITRDTAWDHVGA